MISDARSDSRIVVQLEQKQVFFVLMGILVLASGILVLGYVLGLNVATPASMSTKALADGRRSERGVLRSDDPAEAKVELTFHEKVMSPSAALAPLPAAPTPEERERQGALAKAAVAKAMAKAKAKAATPIESVARAPEQVAPISRTKRPTPDSTSPAAGRRNPAHAVERKVDEAAADALSILRKLREGAPAPAHAAVAAPAALVAPVAGPERRYTVQVGAFQERTDALALLDKLRTRGHNPFLVSSKVRSRGRWYRVRVGRFADKDRAKEYQRRVEVSEGIKGAFVARM